VPGGVKAKPTGVGFADGLDPACLGGVGQETAGLMVGPPYRSDTARIFVIRE